MAGTIKGKASDHPVASPGQGVDALRENGIPLWEVPHIITRNHRRTRENLRGHHPGKHDPPRFSRRAPADECRSLLYPRGINPRLHMRQAP